LVKEHYPMSSGVTAVTPVTALSLYSMYTYTHTYT
jgi:hypothetical protein